MLNLRFQPPHLCYIQIAVLNFNGYVWKYMYSTSEKWSLNQKMCKFKMFITAVCFVFLIKLRWPKNKSIYDEEMLCSGCGIQIAHSQSILLVFCNITSLIWWWLRYYCYLAEFGHGWYSSSQSVPFVSISDSFDAAMGSLAQLLLNKIRTMPRPNSPQSSG